MFIRIENYVVNTDEVAAISLWKKDVNDEVYDSFPMEERNYIEDLDEEYYCILVDFKGMHGDDESEEIKLFVKTSEEARRKFDEVASMLMAAGSKEPLPGFSPVNPQGEAEIPTPVFGTTSNLFSNAQ